MRSGASLVAPYLAALRTEIAQGARDLREAGYAVRAVYVGGGTPTTLSAPQMDDLLCLLRDSFGEAVEWTVEAGRPDTIDTSVLDVFSDRGVGRISVNPQTFFDHTLQAMGRGHTVADFRMAMERVAKYTFRVNVDLIAALPGEGVEDVRFSAREAAAYRPSNITVHALALKRAAVLRQEGSFTHVPEDEARDMVDAARQALSCAGYAPYYLYRQKYMAGNLENVGYCLPGQACLYNIDNMEETASVLAFGAGAISKWLYPRERRIERAPNLRDVRQYIERVAEMNDRKLGLLAKI